VIALVGLVKLFTARQAEQRAWGGFLVFLAMWIVASIEHLWDLSFRTSWPMILIAVGVTHIICGLAGTRDPAKQEAKP
jgi:formate/nitrite transporter FocA (FNT family)